MKKQSKIFMNIVSTKLVIVLVLAAVLAFSGSASPAAMAVENREQDIVADYSVEKAESIAKEQKAIFQKGTDPEYMLESGDIIEVAVWRNEDLSRKLTIRPDGRISLPLAGEIKASGLSPDELSKVIADKLNLKITYQVEI